jgi:hypothetical protein
MHEPGMKNSKQLTGYTIMASNRNSIHRGMRLVEDALDKHDWTDHAADYCN